MRHSSALLALFAVLPAVFMLSYPIVAQDTSSPTVKATTFRVEGKVGKPGDYDLRDNLTPSQALTEAGGPSDGADLSSAYIQRGEEIINVDLSKPADGTSTVVMQSGDTLVVPSLNVSVTGEVQRPGMYALSPGKADRLQDAIKAAGGVTGRANLKKVQIITTQDEKKKTLTVDATNTTSPEGNPVLKKGDAVFVPGPDQKRRLGMNDVYSAAVIILTLLSIF